MSYVFRYVAIVHPIQAPTLCRRKVIITAIVVTWMLAAVCGFPTAAFNQIQSAFPSVPINLCITTFPHRWYYSIYKLIECAIFFLLPVALQAVLYTIVGRHLFTSTFPSASSSMDSDQWRVTRAEAKGQCYTEKENGSRSVEKRTVSSRLRHLRMTCKNQKEPKMIQARRDVVKMLIASVIVYFICYAPAQFPLIYNLTSSKPFSQNWYFLALVMTLAYTNSAINPILYTVFSQKFRKQFSRYLCLRCLSDGATDDRTTSNRTPSRQRHVIKEDIPMTSSVSPAITRHMTTNCTHFSEKFG